MLSVLVKNMSFFRQKQDYCQQGISDRKQRDVSLGARTDPDQLQKAPAAATGGLETGVCVILQVDKSILKEIPCHVK